MNSLPKIEQPYNGANKSDTFRILLLDTDEHIQKLKAACKAAGHEVVPAPSIAAAMEFLERRDHVDVIISGTHLENESVFDFLKRVKSEDMHKHVTFVMLALEPGPTGIVLDTAAAMAGRFLGADHCITMTEFDAQSLIDQLEKMLPPLPSKQTTAAPDVEHKASQVPTE